ncbi:MAG: FAD-dependent oxidoreductase, partial [bacterium]
FQERLTKRKAIYRLYTQAVPAAFMIEKKGVSPCRDACPAKLSGQGYIALINKGKYKEAIEMVRKTLPFPSICGRVCHHPCEEACNRKDVDEPLSIRALKRFIADWAKEQKEEPPEPLKPTKQEKIAVVGAGPAGLACSKFLLEKGYPVTVFDEAESSGGMMTSCLPEYRLPREMADYDINRILALGLDLRMNTKVGRDVSLSDLKKEYRAIFLAIGAQNVKKLRLEGLDATGVFYGIPFLKDIKQGKKVRIGKSVIVIGGGNVAIDCAKSALRLGPREVKLVCLETEDLSSKDRIPAHDWEVEEAKEEGIVLCTSRGPKRILNMDGRISGLETVECVSVYEGKARRFNPKFKEGAESVIEGDTVIIAIGQEIDFTGIPVSGENRIEITPWKTIKTDPISLQTSDPCVFAGGDAVLGPASIVEAAAQGREAAISIDRYIQGIDLKEEREPRDKEIAELPEEVGERIPRNELPKRSPEERIKDFLEIENGFTEEVARKEAARCLDCGICSECMQCVETCKAEAIVHDDGEEIVKLKVGSVILAIGYDMFDAKVKGEYGYGRYKNVVTSIEFERMLSASGPFGGHLVRLSDKKEPERIAFIQCVGSRDPDCGNDYCSAVCCTYAIKEAIIAKEHSKNGLDTTIFYMDMRTHGKGFDAYYERARSEYGVRFVRAGVPKVTEIPDSHDLIVRYEDEEGEFKDEEFDMVVLSVGFESKAGIEDLAKRLGIQLDAFGFCQTDGFLPLETTKEGVYVCGAFSGPKDIPETVVQASGAAGEAMGLLASARETMTTKKEYPPEMDVRGQP